METFFTVGEISKMLKVSEVMVYKLVRHDKIPFVRVSGKTVRFRESEINEWIEQGRGKRYYRDKHREALAKDPHGFNQN